MKIHDRVKTIFLAIAALCGLFLYGKGIIHSFRAHKFFDPTLSFVLPPFGLFRGVESFYHKKTKKDFLNDAEKEKAQRAILKLLSIVPQNQDDETKLDKAAEETSRKLTHYNAEAVAHLKSMAQMYIRLHAALSEDINELMMNLMEDAINVDPSNWDKRSKPVMDSLTSVYDSAEITTKYKIFDSTLIILKKKIAEKDINLKQKLRPFQNA